MKKILIILLIAIVVIACERKSGRGNVQPLTITHPDKLTNHILINNSRGIDSPNSKWRVYNYKDSTYSTVYVPTIIAVQYTELDTIKPK